MFNFFRKKEPLLEFVSLLPEVAQLMPIEPTKDVKFNWVKEAIKDYKQIREEDDPINIKNDYPTTILEESKTVGSLGSVSLQQATRAGRKTEIRRQVKQRPPITRSTRAPT